MRLGPGYDLATLPFSAFKDCEHVASRAAKGCRIVDHSATILVVGSPCVFGGMM
jgi:hypothetical protein